MLKAWRLTAEPTDATDTPATANHDHRRHYLDYDGPVSGGRGTVTRVAVGTYVGELNETWCVQWNAGTATLSHGPTGLVFRFTDTPLLEELE